MCGSGSFDRWSSGVRSAPRPLSSHDWPPGAAVVFLFARGHWIGPPAQANIQRLPIFSLPFAHSLARSSALPLGSRAVRPNVGGSTTRASWRGGHSVAGLAAGRGCGATAAGLAHPRRGAARKAGLDPRTGKGALRGGSGKSPAPVGPGEGDRSPLLLLSFTRRRWGGFLPAFSVLAGLLCWSRRRRASHW